METRTQIKSMLFKIGLSALVTLIIFSHYYFAPIQSRNFSGGFKRVVLQNVILKPKSFHLEEDDHYYLAGTICNQIYLGTESDALNLLSISNDLDKLDKIEIRVDSLKALPERAYLQIDSPFVYVADKVGSYLWRGMITNWKVRPIITLPPFVQFVCIDSSNFAIHTTIGKRADRAENVIGKIQTATSHVLLNRKLLEKQGDGIYSTDGMLRYNHELKKIIYVYFYRNEYIVTDTQLRKTARANTVDTVHVAKLDPVILGVNNFSLATRPIIVNQNARCYKQFLLIQSLIRAQNDMSEDFDLSSVIDVYDLIKSKYRFSFYIPNENGEQMKNFYIAGNKLIVLFGGQLMSYDLHVEYFIDDRESIKKITDQ